MLSLYNGNLLLSHTYLFSVFSDCLSSTKWVCALSLWWLVFYVTLFCCLMKIHAKKKLTVGFICTLITYSTPTINPREGVVFSRLWPSVFRHLVGIHTFEWVVCWMSYTLSMKPKSNGFTTTDCSSSQYIIYWAPGKAVRRTHKVALVMSHWRSLYRVAKKECNDFDH